MIVTNTEKKICKIGKKNKKTRVCPYIELIKSQKERTERNGRKRIIKSEYKEISQTEGNEFLD